MNIMERHDKFVIGCIEGMLYYVNMTGYIYKPRQKENVEQYELDYAQDYCTKIFDIKYGYDEPRKTKEISGPKD
jgi:hypothetical protein